MFVLRKVVGVTRELRDTKGERRDEPFLFRLNFVQLLKFMTACRRRAQTEATAAPVPRPSHICPPTQTHTLRWSRSRASGKQCARVASRPRIFAEDLLAAIHELRYLMFCCFENINQLSRSICGHVHVFCISLLLLQCNPLNGSEVGPVKY